MPLTPQIFERDKYAPLANQSAIGPIKETVRRFVEEP